MTLHAINKEMQASEALVISLNAFMRGSGIQLVAILYERLMRDVVGDNCGTIATGAIAR